ncbi:ABC transporter ATP-binding protein [Spirochaetota bacterium]
MSKIIRIESLHKEFLSGKAKLVVLENIDFDAEEGDLITVFGESGSGKSTFLNMIGGLDIPTSGDVYIDTHNIVHLKERRLSKIRNRYIGFVFQNHNLLIEFTALENVFLPYMIEKWRKREAVRKAMEILCSIGLEKRVHHKIGELSGGEQQRVAIARALMNSPKVVLADEPTGNLDAKNTEMINNIFSGLNKKFNTTIIIATHSRQLAQISNKSYLLENRKLHLKK